MDTLVAGAHRQALLGESIDFQLGEVLLESSQCSLRIKGINGRDPLLLLKLWLRRLELGGDLLGSTVDDLPVDLGALDQPVVGTVARDALGDAVFAKVEITIITSRAVVVNIWRSLFAAVAADGEPRSIDGSLGLGPLLGLRLHTVVNGRRWSVGRGLEDATEHVGLGNFGSGCESVVVVGPGHGGS